jgi:hypothetical protein
MTPFGIELLEARRLLSISVADAEPNNVRTEANPINRALNEHVLVNGTLGALGDRDWFKINLQKGDVFGAALTGAAAGVDTVFNVYDAAAQLVIGNDDAFHIGDRALPPESPLPHNTVGDRDSETFYVITAPGTYYMEVSAFDDQTAGAYQLDLLVARPGMESKPVGARQVFFLDLDGARVNFNEFQTGRDENWGTQAISPLSRSLKDWGLRSSDLSPLIDATIARITSKVSTFVRNNGLNGDFVKTGTPGQFDVEIRNSRDHRDEFGSNPLTARVILGASDFTPLNNGIALGQFNDPGNFKTNDQAVITTNYIADLLSAYRIAAPATKIDFIAEFLSLVASHEIGHLTGCFHTHYDLNKPFQGRENIMDKVIQAPLGPDLIFGTADDIAMNFGADRYSDLDLEKFKGIDDTLNTVAFGLSTGKGSAAAPAAGGAPAPISPTFGSTRFDSPSTLAVGVDERDELSLL